MKITDSNYKPNQTELHMGNTSVELSNTVKHKDKTQENVEICKQSVNTSKAKSQEFDAISYWKGSSQEKSTINNYVSTHLSSKTVQNRNHNNWMLISHTWTIKKRQLIQGHTKATEFYN